MQMQAIKYIISGSSYPAPYILFGPPGTGKTSAIVECIAQIVKTQLSPRILVTAPSNAACEEVAKRLLKVSNIPNSIMYRIYGMNKDWKTVENCFRTCSNFYEEQVEFEDIKCIMKHKIIVTTLATAGRLLLATGRKDIFTHIFIDEGGQCTEPELLISAALLIQDKKLRCNESGQLIIIGDHKQLGPIVSSTLAAESGLGISLLERLMTTCKLYMKHPITGYNPNVITKLLHNFRSHPKIMEVSNKEFYDNELQFKGPPEVINLCLGWKHLPNKNFPIIFHSVHGKDEQERNSPSYFNRLEMLQVIDYISKILGKKFKHSIVSQQDIGVITPYKRQVQKLSLTFKKKGWPNISIGSVETFQGQERKIIIISTVRSSVELISQDHKFRLGFLKNPKRFNVSITRAQSLLIVIGNPNTLQGDKHWLRFILFCQKNGGFTGKPFTVAEQCEKNKAIVGSVDQTLLNDMKQLMLS